jgi:hypothetical protein
VTTDADGAVLSIFGWCVSAVGTTPDHHHNLCHREYRTELGVIHRCACPAHKNDTED